jgi:hypothetical protein
VERETIVACLDNIDGCGVTFSGEFTTPDNDTFDIADVESALAELEHDAKELRKYLTWAKTCPARETATANA